MAYLDAVADAERYTAAVDSLTERQAAKTDEATEEIREAFNNQTPLPFVSGATARLAYMPFKEAATDVICEKEVYPAFLAMLKTSNCPKVKALIAAMADKYVAMWADEVGEVLA